MRSFARTWTTDLKHRRIRVNAISPGFIDTPGSHELLTSTETDQETNAMVKSMVPFGRFGTSDEIAKAVDFSPPTTAAMSREWNCSRMAASRRYKCLLDDT
jgi:NAD(P)-dependent dehydrogenase (short-subunit alcohol dehydrogenase family)